MFDGVSTVLGLTPIAGAYTMDQDIFALNMTVDAGAVVNTNGFRIYVAQTLTVVATGFIQNNGGNGDGDGIPGLGAPTNNVLGGGDGGTGGLNANGDPGVNVAFYPSRSIGNGGNGGNAVTNLGGAGGTGEQQTGFGTYMVGTMAIGDSVSGGAGGGGGGGDAASQGGGGGGGAGVIVICAQHIIAPANAIRALGGSGGNGGGISGGGGGGCGGTIIIVTNDNATPTFDLSGGAGGAAGGGGGSPGVAGDTGARIAISPIFGPL